MVLKTHEPLDLVVILLGTNDAKRVYATNALTSLEKGMDLFMHEAMDPDNFKRSLKAVSYTHLDVYKRQDLRQPE